MAGGLPGREPWPATLQEQGAGPLPARAEPPHLPFVYLIETSEEMLPLPRCIGPVPLPKS
jgi:hypothetical protein